VVKIDMTRQIKIDGDASMVTSWNGVACVYDVSMTSAVGLPQVTKSELECNPSPSVVTLAPTLGLRRRKGRRLSNGWAQVDD